MTREIVQDAEYLPLERYEVDDDQPETTSADRKVSAIQSALNDDPEAYLNVTRQTMGGNSPQEFVGRYPADKFDFGQLQVHLKERHGGGDYRVMLYAKGKIRANKLISIAHEKENLGAGKLDENNTLLAVLQRMDNMQRQMIDMMSQKNEQPSRQEMLQEMMMFKQIFDGGNNANANPLGQLRDLIALQKELGLGAVEPQEKEAGFTDLLEKATPLFTAAINAQPHKPQQTNQSESQKMQFIVKMGVKQLLNAANKNSDPATYAEMIIDQFPQEMITKLITPENAIEKFAVIEPKVNAFKPWFIELIEHVKAQLGLPSKVEHLYSDSEADIIPEKSGGDGNGELSVNDDK